MSGQHDDCGRDEAEGGPIAVDCQHRLSVEIKDCAASGCGFCIAETTKAARKSLESKVSYRVVEISKEEHKDEAEAIKRVICTMDDELDTSNRAMDRLDEALLNLTSFMLQVEDSLRLCVTCGAAKYPCAMCMRIRKAFVDLQPFLRSPEGLNAIRRASKHR